MSTIPARKSGRLTVAITLSATAFTATLGLSYPLLSLILERQGVPAWLIGANAAMTAVGMIAAAFIAPRLMPRVGALRFSAGSHVGTLCCLVAIGVWQDVWWWMPLRLLLGLFLAAQFVVSDTWINQLAADSHRGRILGVYSAVLSTGFAAGPAILLALGAQGWPPFMAGAGLLLTALTVLLAVRHELPAAHAERHTSVWRFLPLAPLLLLAVAAVAFADEAVMSLLPVYVIQYGHAEQIGTAALIAMIAGSVSLQYPIGWLADRVPRGRVMFGCALLAAASALLMAFTAGTQWLLWGVVFVWGGAYYALHVLSLVRLGERFSGALLVAGSAALGAMWGVGGLLGPATLGGAMSLVGPLGLPYGLAVLFAIVAAVFWWYDPQVSGREQRDKKPG